MQTAIRNMVADGHFEHMPESVLTFRPFIDHLRKRKEETSCHKSRFFSFVVEQFEKHPELLQPIDVDRVKEYQELMQLIYTMLSPIVEDEETHRWALVLPLKPVVFYSTNAYSRLVTDIQSGNLKKGISEKKPAELRREQQEFIYSLILEKCYGYSSFFNRDIIHTLEDEASGLTNYFKLSVDTRFVEIFPLKPLPELKANEFRSSTNDHSETIACLQEKLPLENFRIEGFGILSISDVTAEYSIENIRDIILNRSSFDEENYYPDVIRSLKTLVGNNDIEFGLLPLFQVNNKLVFDEGIWPNSKLISVAKEHGVGELAYMAMASEYSKNPKPLFFGEITVEDEARQGYLKMLKNKGVSSYALTPVFFKKSLAGVIEIYSFKKNIMNEEILGRLNPAMTLLSQLLQNSIDEFNSNIDRVVKEKFTSVQPSVQWKFKEAAWQYLREDYKKIEHPEIGEVVFEKVYPLYGAVDIRNSTIERNTALEKDLVRQFTILLDTLQQLKLKSGFGLIDEKIFVSSGWLQKIKDVSGFSEEVKLNDYMENDLVPFLLQFKKGHPAYEAIIDKYFQAINEEKGIAFENRRQLEASMNTVISSVNNYIELMKGEIQQAYPSYFEKFKTDGVEYDIYIGQAIAPDKPFNEIYLNNLRLLQISSMAAIAKYSHALLPQLPRQVETTQLIFIHSQPIDIKFRKDEKRFDVEGAYNIRYHIVKKRIDKVIVRGTNERLTQPGKIALVYFSRKEAEEFISYIRYLQEQKILNDDLEELELEELQGVSGLKALRVGVTL